MFLLRTKALKDSGSFYKDMRFCHDNRQYAQERKKCFSVSKPLYDEIKASNSDYAISKMSFIATFYLTFRSGTTVLSVDLKKERTNPPNESRDQPDNFLGEERDDGHCAKRLYGQKQNQLSHFKENEQW